MLKISVFQEYSSQKQVRAPMKWANPPQFGLARAVGFPDIQQEAYEAYKCFQALQKWS